MSATLTWNNSGLATKTGTTLVLMMTDIIAMVAANAANADFLWEVASSNVIGTPGYCVLQRKDASPGRILLVYWTSSPAGNNAALLSGAPTTDVIYISWFPAGNVDSPSNLTASSGTILGDDTGCLQVGAPADPSSYYGSLVQPFYFESAESVFFGFQNPASTNCFWFGAGDLLVDASDVAYGAILTPGPVSAGNLGFSAASGSNSFAWDDATTFNPTSANPRIVTNYGSANRPYFQAWAPSAAWVGHVADSADILTDIATTRAWFVPIQLLGRTKGEGFVLKLRQIAHGPQSAAAFAAYSTTGPVVAATRFNGNTAGGQFYPWFTNFKL